MILRSLTLAVLGSLLVLCAMDPGEARGQKAGKRGQGAQPAKRVKPPVSRLPQSVRDGKPDEMKVAAVIASRRDQVAAAAAEIDLRIESRLLSLGFQPNALANEETFLRRVYLDVAGRIPTLSEVNRYFASDPADRRQELIDQLLSSPDYVSNFFNFWADTLRLVDSPQNNIVAQPYLAYVKDSIRENRQYDQWVYEMLTADGKLWENPATGYQLRDEGMPLPYIDNTVRVFLGTQVGCAQCHDHPFDNWSQYQFYQLAAFTAGTRTKIARGSPGFEKVNPAQKFIKEAQAKYPGGKVPGAMQRMIRANSYQVSEVKANLRLPHDYAYADAKPGDVVKPEVLWGEIPSTAAQRTPRQQFAAWLTSSENTQFKKTIVNRLWKRLMGIGLVEPIDDFRDDSECSNEEVMDFLCEQLVRSDFDLKEILRTILYSETYSREATDYQVTSGDSYHFPGPVVRRMTAEQVWDSLLTLAANNAMPFQRPTAAEIAPTIDIDFSNATLATIEKAAETFGKTYAAAAYQRSLRTHAYQGVVLCRASELPSPSPGSHFLRQFGQGDRESINGQEDTANVPQILSMFNGPITHVMLEAGSSIYDNVVSSANPREAIEAIFLSVLTRRPSSDDRSIAASEISRAERPGIGYGNVIWALLNTKEFLFIQ